MHTLKRKNRQPPFPNNSAKPYSHFGLAAYVILEKKKLAIEEAKVFPF